MSALALYEIAHQHKELDLLLDSGEVPEEVVRDTLESVTGSFDDKAILVAKFILSLEAHAQAIHEAALAMNTRADRVQQRADSIRAYLLFNLQSIDRKRIDTAELVIKRVTNPPAVQITDEDAVPAKFWVQPPPPPERLDKKAIAAALKAGEAVSGAFIESGERLSITI